MNGFVLLSDSGALHAIEGDSVRPFSAQPALDLKGDVKLSSFGRAAFAVTDGGDIANLQLEGLVRHDGEVQYTGLFGAGGNLAVIAAPRGIVMLEAATLEDDYFIESDDDVSAVALRGGRVFAALINKKVRSFDPEAGTWAEVGALPFVPHTLVVASDDTLLAVGNGALARMDGRDGRLTTSKITGSHIDKTSVVALVGRQLFIGTEDGVLLRYDVAERHLLTLGKIDRPVTALAAHDDLIAVGSASSVTLFRQSGGELQLSKTHQIGAAQIVPVIS